MHSQSTGRRPPGFSLAELLVTIAILGVIASLAVASVSGVTAESSVTAAKAQAQRIASTFGAGQATGAPGFAGADSVDSAMNAVGAGSYGAGINHNTWFQLPGISAHMDAGKPASEQAQTYLSWNAGLLTYNPDGSGHPGAGWIEIPPPDVARLTETLMGIWEGPPNPSLADLIALVNQNTMFPYELMTSGGRVYARERMPAGGLLPA